jgi:hypothetical protein
MFVFFCHPNRSQTSRLYHPNISEEPAATVIRVEDFFYSEHGGRGIP